MNEMLETLGRNAKEAEIVLRNLDTAKKNQVLEAVADSLVADSKALLTANAIDVENGRKNQMPEGLVDRLMLTEARIASMAEGLRQVAALEDPIGEVTGMKKTSQRTSHWTEESPSWSDRNHLRGKTKCDSRCFCPLL